MILQAAPDLPTFHGDHFDAVAPCLPRQAQAAAAIDPCPAPSVHIGAFHLSLATLNVMSLFSGPSGHAGKLDYF